eukprot:m.584723 g.584723  ORF g.584723 m.584723 type:complete len:50 (-) comp57965_c0_seq38:710-859(-)
MRTLLLLESMARHRSGEHCQNQSHLESTSHFVKEGLVSRLSSTSSQKET